MNLQTNKLIFKLLKLYFDNKKKNLFVCITKI